MPELDLGYDPRPWQAEVHRNLKRFGVLVCHRRAGKTVLAVMQLVIAALLNEKGNARYAYLAPYLKQAKTVAWMYLTQYARKIPGSIVNEGELWVQLPNGSQIRIFGADNADSLRGIYLDGVVLDEVAQMSPNVWQEVLRPALSDRQGWALFIGTPQGQNLFSELYNQARGNPHEWYHGSYTVYDTGALEAGEIASIKAELTKNVFAREFMCDFSASADNVLLSVSDVDEASRRHANTGDYDFAPKIIGVDVARQGDDATVIFRRQGIASFTPIVMQGSNAMAVADRVALEINEWAPDAVFVDGTGGYGAGVIDRLRSLSHKPIEVQFGGQAGDERYLNKRAEMWFKLAEWIKGGGIIPPVQRLKEDLCTPTYDHNDRDKLRLESKDDIKKRGLPSPDYGDALALTFAYVVHPQGVRDHNREQASHRERQQRFDPLARVRRLRQ
jgi:hypothetical protein